MKRIKNATGTDKIWVGQTIEAGSYHTLETFEEPRWASNSILLTAIANGEAIVATASDDILDVSEAINFLKDITRIFAIDYSETKYKTISGGSEDLTGGVVIPNGQKIGLINVRVNGGLSTGIRVMVVFDYNGLSEKIFCSSSGDVNAKFDPTSLTNQVIGDGIKKLMIVLINDDLTMSPIIGGAFTATKV